MRMSHSRVPQISLMTVAIRVRSQGAELGIAFAEVNITMGMKAMKKSMYPMKGIPAFRRNMRG